MRSILFFGLFLVVCCAGCGESGFTVGGKVTFPDGSPLTRGEVTLNSSLFTAGGPIAADGTYTINARVPAGTYQVTVRASADRPSSASMDVENAPPVQSLVHPKYNSAETSGLTVEVKAKTTHNIEVTAPS